MSVTRIRNPSLEFNWLPNSLRKGLSTPRMFLADEYRWGGFYSHRTPERCIHPALDVDLSEGPVICLCASRNPGVIAHEYRHHWQLESGHRFGNSVWDIQHGETYAASIIRYFRSYWWEMDALQFEIRVAPNDLSLQWDEWVRAAA